MKNTASLFYGLVTYLAFSGTALYAIGFTSNFIVPEALVKEGRKVHKKLMAERVLQK